MWSLKSLKVSKCSYFVGHFDFQMPTLYFVYPILGQWYFKTKLEGIGKYISTPQHWRKSVCYLLKYNVGQIIIRYTTKLKLSYKRKAEGFEKKDNQICSQEKKESICCPPSRVIKVSNGRVILILLPPDNFSTKYLRDFSQLVNKILRKFLKSKNFSGTRN